VERNAAPPLAPSDLLPAKIDKSQLFIAEPKRLRDKAHLKLSPYILVLSAGDSDPIHITCILLSPERWI
jgi:hypothetical protein